MAEGKVFPVGGAGIVRACVANSDGTSNLVLQGLSRVRFLSWAETEPFPLATVSTMDSTPGPVAASAALRKEVMKLARQMSGGNGSVPAHLLEILAQATSVENFADTSSAWLVADPVVRLRLLEELDVSRRLEIVAAYLTHLIASRD